MFRYIIALTDVHQVEGEDLLTEMHRSLIRLADRAERINDSAIVDSFVDAQPLFDLLSTENNQIVYGRRGTGKTHALLYLSGAVRQQGSPSIYLDFRELGSNSSIYADPAKDLAVRATSLVQDVLAAVHDELLKIAIESIDFIDNHELVTRSLENLANECTRTKIVGQTEISETEKETLGASGSTGANINLSQDPKLNLSAEQASSAEESTIRSRTLQGQEIAHLSFGALQEALRNVLASLNTSRLWIIMDEWSVIPFDLQPYMADILRRCFMPLSSITIKFAAIEHRTNFKINLIKGQYIGFELGADVSADVNLDDFMVFDNDSERSKDFFSNLIYNHLRATDESMLFKKIDKDELIRELFNQTSTFEEFVRASEGVPRDALHLLSTAVQASFGVKITTPVVRRSAQTWYTRDKSATISQNTDLSDLLQRIIDVVIGHRKARAFLFQADAKDERLEELFDARLLHILKRNISSHDSPGKRYNAFKLDYGCYVDLINTSNATQGLFNSGEGAYVDVPPDDWRSIRRAILEPSDMPAT